MKVKAKMKVVSVLQFEGGETVQLQAVYGDSEENKTWSKWTPSGSLQLSVTNPAVFGEFVPGVE